MKISIPEDLGQQLREMSFDTANPWLEIDGLKYKYIDTEYDVEDHRWADTDLMIYEREDGKLFGMKWDNGATENQESGFIYNAPELYEVEAREVKRTIYEAVK